MDTTIKDEKISFFSTSLISAILLGVLFLTIYGQSISSLQGGVATSLDRFKEGIVKNEDKIKEIEYAIYLSIIGYWVIWLWFFVFFIFLVVSLVTRNKWIWLFVILLFFVCALINCVTATMAERTLRDYGELNASPNIILTAQYNSELVAWNSGIILFALLLSVIILYVDYVKYNHIINTTRSNTIELQEMV